MGRRKLSEEERIKSREKRLEYLRNYRKEHGMEYYKKNKERIAEQRRAKREQEKGSPLNSHNKINLKNMTKEERNEYYKIKNRESRARKRERRQVMNEYPKDILFDIDMQLYDEFNDKIATMNDHLGDIYSLRDVEEVEKVEKEKEIKLLREAVKKLQKEIEELKTINQMQKYRIEVMDERELISRDEVEEIIKTRIKEIQNMYDKLSKNPKEHLHSKTEYLIVICELQSILNEIKGDDK